MVRHLKAENGGDLTRQIQGQMPSYQVVWDGRRGGPDLLPDRAERVDPRFNTMPNYDLNDSDQPFTNRAYNCTGKFKGIFSRTNPAARNYKPTATLTTFDSVFDKSNTMSKEAK